MPCRHLPPFPRPRTRSTLVHAGMAGHLNQAAWSTRTSLGGLWNWDRNINTVAAGISTTGVAATDEQMTAIDQAIDAGNLFTGSFRRITGRSTAILQR